MDERPDGAWHAEWEALRELLTLATTAAAQAADLTAGAELADGARAARAGSRDAANPAPPPPAKGATRTAPVAMPTSPALIRNPFCEGEAKPSGRCGSTKPMAKKSHPSSMLQIMAAHRAGGLPGGVQVGDDAEAVEVEVDLGAKACDRRVQALGEVVNPADGPAEGDEYLCAGGEPDAVTGHRLTGTCAQGDVGQAVHGRR
ncbi:hypothetical protein [Nocardia gipuzkoensis]|uniref:hypothetical protein n=1 Tax=Nocardia gipuzkoensis TaxID=2749991 RepID=UPI001C6706BA|nr:hypothetical protein [Nocardia gipuzkoensis]